nr:hypothetical protein [Rhizobium leguminosarum]
MNEAPFFRNGSAPSIKECIVFQDRISPTHRTIPGSGLSKNFAEIDDSLGFSKTPILMRLVRPSVSDVCIGAELPKSLLDQITGNVFKQCTANALSTVFGIDPDAFEKRDGLCSAAVSVFPYANLGKTKRRLVGTQRKIAGPFLAFEHSAYIAKMFIDRKAVPELEAHLSPKRTVACSHLSDHN